MITISLLWLLFAFISVAEAGVSNLYYLKICLK